MCSPHRTQTEQERLAQAREIRVTQQRASALQDKLQQLAAQATASTENLDRVRGEMVALQRTHDDLVAAEASRAQSLVAAEAQARAEAAKTEAAYGKLLLIGQAYERIEHDCAALRRSAEASVAELAVAKQSAATSQQLATQRQREVESLQQARSVWQPSL